MIKFAWTSIDKMLTEGFEDLLVAHWEEVALHKDDVPFAPDWDRYRALEKTGVFKALAMYRHGFLVGYNCFFVQPHLHYKLTLCAVNDIIYVDPGSRGAGFRLVKEAEKRLGEMGVKVITYHTKLAIYLTGDHRPATVGDLLAKLGYSHAENNYQKLLKD